MVDLATQNQQVQQSNLNPLIGSFQQQVPSTFSAIGDSLVQGFKALNRTPTRQTARDDFDPGLASALLDLSPQVRADIERDAARFDAIEMQRGSKDLRARRIALARQYAEANPGREREIFQTFKVAATEGLGAEILKLQEDFEAEQVAEFDRMRDRATSIGIATVGRSPTEWLPELMETERDLQAAGDLARTRAMLGDQQALSKQEILQHWQSKTIPAILNNVRSAFQSLGFGTKPGEAGQLLDIQNTDEQALAAEKARVDDFFFNTESQLIENLAGTGFNQAEVELTMLPLKRLRDQAQAYLSGEDTLEAYENVAEVTAAVYKAKFVKDNPNINEAMALVTAMGPILRLADTDANRETKRQAGEVIGALMPTLMSASNNFVSNLIAGGIEDPKLHKELMTDMTKFILDERNDFYSRGETARNMLAGMVNATELKPALLNKMIPLFIDGRTMPLLISGLDEQENIALQQKVLNGFDRQFSDMKAQYIEDINDLMSTSFRVGDVQRLPGPFGIFSVPDAVSLIDFTEDGDVVLTPEARERLDEDQQAEAEDILAQVHEVRSSQLIPLLNAIDMLNMARGRILTKKEQAEQERKEETLTLEIND